MSNLKRYPDYKDSGVPWLGKIPSHWKAIAIKHISRVHRGASPRPIADPKYFDDEGEYAWVRIADVTASDQYLLETTQRLSELGSSLSVKMQPEDIFLSIAGSVGKPIITKVKACIHDGFVYFPDWDQSTRFLYYIFASGQPYLGLGKLGTQLNLNTDTVGHIKIGLPPINEQKLIVSFLDKKLSHIDTLIGKQKQLLEKLAEQRSAVITHAVTKGLNPDVPMKDSGVEWLGKIPKHWLLKKMKFLISELRVGPFGSALKHSDFTYSGKAVFNQRSVLDKNLIDNKYYISEDKFEELKSFAVKKGDFLLTTRGTIGKVAVVPEEASEGIIHPCLIRFRVRAGLLRKEYVELYFNQINLVKEQLAYKSNSTTIDVVYSDSLKDIFIAIPELEEQKAIIDYLIIETEKTDQMINATKNIIGKLNEYRSALITQAVTGKIDVRDVGDQAVKGVA